MDKNLETTVNDSDIPVTLKQGHGHQPWFELLDPEQDYDYAKFEKPPLSSVCQKTTFKFIKSENESFVSLEYVQK